MRDVQRSRAWYLLASAGYGLVVYTVLHLAIHAEEVASGLLPPEEPLAILRDMLPEHYASLTIYLAFSTIAALIAYRIAAATSAALATEQRRASELAIVSGLADRLGEMRDVDEIGATGAAALRQVVAPTTTVSYIGFDPENETFRICSEEGPRAGAFSGEPYPLAVLPEGFRGQLLTTRRPVVIADTESEGADWLGLASRFTPLATSRTFAAIPLIARDRLVGALMLRDDAPDALASGRFDLVALLAHGIASALANAISLTEAERRAEREGLLHRIAQRSRESFDANEVLRRAVEELGRGMHATRAFVALGTSPDDLRVTAEWVAEGEQAIGRGSQYVPIPRVAAREGKTVVVRDVEQDLRLAPEGEVRDVLAFGTRSAIATPIGIHGQTVGVLTVSQSGRRRHWSSDEVGLVEAAANELRISMEAARQFASRQRETERMLSLHHASAVLAGQTDPGVILEEILKNSVRLLGHGSASLFVYVPEARVLRNVRDHNVRGGARMLRPGEGIAGTAFERLAPVIVNDYQNWESANALALEAGQRAAMSVPLIRQGQAIGALVVRSYDAAVRFTDDDGHLLTLFADQAVAALAAAEAFEQQRAAVQELERLSTAKSDFISIVSHEFRTPLTGIMGFSEMMRDEDLELSEIREYAADINKDAQRLNRMISDMLDLDRMESGRMRIYREGIDLHAIVRDVADRFIPNSVKHAIRLELDPSIPELWADRDKVTQVLTNLLSNAVKYSPDGGAIVIRTARDGEYVRVSVQDHGLGIPGDALERVFDRYSRVENRDTRHIQGTGLGLPIVRQIVGMHGGRVWVDSRIGEGSVFQFTLPLAPPPEDERVVSAP